MFNIFKRKPKTTMYMIIVADYEIMHDECDERTIYVYSPKLFKSESAAQKQVRLLIRDIMTYFNETCDDHEYYCTNRKFKNCLYTKDNEVARSYHIIPVDPERMKLYS